MKPLTAPMIPRPSVSVRLYAQILGVVLLLVGLLGFVVPTPFGLLPDGYTLFDNLLHLALGVASIAVALFGRGSVAAARG